MVCLGQGEIVSPEVERLCFEAVCSMYSTTSTKSKDDVNELRYELFCLGQCEPNLPPTSDAVVLHIKRANFQALAWRRSLYTHMHLPNPVNHGWKMVSGELEIVWQLLPEVPSDLKELAYCGCKKLDCTSKRCACFKAGMACSPACKCQDCRNKS